MSKILIQRSSYLGFAIGLLGGLFISPIPKVNETGYYISHLLIYSILGIIVGEIIKKSKNVNMAFLLGFFVFGLLAIGLGALYYFFDKAIISQNGILLILIVAACGAILTGISSIYVRDYRCFQQLRPIPQFSLLELLIFFTLTSVVISAVCCYSIEVTH
jgi:hypothetical protein